MPTTHARKIEPRHFRARLDGRKEWEIRREDDARFEVGDFLVLREWIPPNSDYTGAEEVTRITHVVRDAPGLAPGFAILSTETIWVHQVGADMQRKLDLQWEAAKAVEKERNELQQRMNNLQMVIDSAKDLGWLDIENGIAVLAPSSGDDAPEYCTLSEAARIVREHNERAAQEEQVYSVEVATTPVPRDAVESIATDLIAGRLECTGMVFDGEGVQVRARWIDDNPDETAGIPTDLAAGDGHVAPDASKGMCHVLEAGRSEKEQVRFGFTQCGITLADHLSNLRGFSHHWPICPGCGKILSDRTLPPEQQKEALDGWVPPEILPLTTRDQATPAALASIVQDIQTGAQRPGVPEGFVKVDLQAGRWLGNPLESDEAVWIQPIDSIGDRGESPEGRLQDLLAMFFQLPETPSDGQLLQAVRNLRTRAESAEAWLRATKANAP